MSRKKAHGPARHQRGMPRARDLVDGQGQPIDQPQRASTTISHGYRGKAAKAGKAHAPHPRDLWKLEVDTWMNWDCADCGQRIPRDVEHHVHRQTGNHRCTDCQSWTYPE